MTAVRARLGPVAGLVLVAAALLGVPAPVRAADVTFGTPDAKASYGRSIVFTVEVTTGRPLDRVELRLRFPDSLGPYIVALPPPASTGSSTLRYELDLSGDGHVVPNTPIGASWAAFTAPDAEPITSATDTIRYRDTTHDWRSVKGDLMTVHWYEGGQAFADKALRIGERAIRQTSELLGVTETEPVDFFIYGDQGSFRDALGPGTRENVGGQAHADIRTLFALIGPNEIDDPWVSIVVPHELVHLVFDTAVRNPYRFPPRWLNEGLATFLSEGYASDSQDRVRRATSRQELIPLVALGGQFPTDSERTLLAYAESVSAIDYFVRREGEAALVQLVTAYADGLTDDEAFTRATGRDLEAFQAGWLSDLGASEPTQYGPQPAPAGPLPAGWSGPPPSAGPAATPAAPAATPATPTAGPVATAAAPPDVPRPGAASSGVSPLALAAVALAVILVVAGVVLFRRRGPAAP